MAMERLSHDLNLALEESSRQERRRIGFRRRTRSAGNLPAAVAVSIAEDGSSSSPPQAPLITQPLSDSDDPQLNSHKGLKARHYCQIGNFESDSFNENFSPTRPANARRKRKYKKMPVDYMDGTRSPPIEILSISTEPCDLPASISLQSEIPISMLHSKHKQQPKEKNAFCGKRKWSHRDKGDGSEMRERSFSGGCTSKATFLSKNYDFKAKNFDKKKKESLLQPGKIVLKSQNLEPSKTQSATATNTPSLPGSSSFNFVYKHPKIDQSIFKGYKISTELPPFFKPGSANVFGKHRRSKSLSKTLPQDSLRNPLQFDDPNGMECVGNESSSISSSDSDEVTNDSDREGDDELTDWPGIEELKVFNKSLTFKSSKVTTTPKTATAMPPPKRLKKEFRTKSGLCLNINSKSQRFKNKRAKVDSGNDEDAAMSDSKTIIDLEDDVLYKENILQPHSSFTSFSDVKNAGVSGLSANETFFQSFQTFQENAAIQDDFSQAPRTNFSLQKTSSSDLNISERSPQSDHYYSEHSMGQMVTEVREIRAGCRRIRDERPGFSILSAANEQLSKFLQDSLQSELKLPMLNDPEEREKLESLATLYSLELKVEMGRPVLKKTRNTTQAIRVEHSLPHFQTDHKRRCYGDANDVINLSDQSANSNQSTNSNQSATSQSGTSNETTHSNFVNDELKVYAIRENGARDNFSTSLINKSLLDPGEID